jgi:hypothetical protein
MIVIDTWMGPMGKNKRRRIFRASGLMVRVGIWLTWKYGLQ